MPALVSELVPNHFQIPRIDDAVGVSVLMMLPEIRRRERFHFAVKRMTIAQLFEHWTVFFFHEELRRLDRVRLES